MRTLARWGLAGALLLLTPALLIPARAGAAKAPPKKPTPTPTPKASTAPKSGAGHIAYVGANGNVFVIKPDGTDKRALTNNGTGDPPYNTPLISPKGPDTGILAIRFASGLGAFKGSDTSGLWLISPSGDARRLDANVPRGYAWTPDGASIVYEEGFLSQTSLIVLDTRTGRKRTLPCDPTFKLVDVTSVGGIGNRAIGVRGNDIVAESLADGTTQGLTSYGAGAKAGVWGGLAALDPSGRTAFYAEVPGTTLVSIDLRTRRTGRTTVGGTLAAIAPASATAYAYTSNGDRGATGAVVNGKGVAGLRAGAVFTPHAFAPNGAALTYSVGGAAPYVYVAPAACPSSCATRLDYGRDASWGA